MLEINHVIPSSSFKGFGNSRRHPYASSGEHFDFTAFINLCAAMVPGREPTRKKAISHCINDNLLLSPHYYNCMNTCTISGAV